MYTWSLKSNRFKTLYKLILSLLLLFSTTLFADNVNIALAGTASQSSTSYSGVASRAIDNNTDGIYSNNSVTHTNSNNSGYEWWYLDLGSVHNISQLDIFNRTDSCCKSRLASARIMVSDTPFTQTTTSAGLDASRAHASWEGQIADPPLNQTTFALGTSIAVRYILIQKTGNTDALSLAEVQVWEPDLIADISINEYQVPSPLTVNINDDISIFTRVLKDSSADSEPNILVEFTYNMDVILSSITQINGGEFSNCDKSSGDIIATGSKITCTKTTTLATPAPNKDITTVVKPQSSGILIQTAKLIPTTIDPDLSNNEVNSTSIIVNTVDTNSTFQKIGEYTFDTCSVGAMSDNSGSGNNGAVQNIESEDVFPRHEEKGMICRAGRFYSFVANYATAGTNLQTDANGSFSIALSMEWSGNHGDLPIITKVDDYALVINEGELFYKLGSDINYTKVPNFSISQNIAYHLTFIATGTQIKVYKDGSLTDALDHNYTHEDNANITYIGTNQTNYYSGLLDEINFYKGIIDFTTIAEHAGRTLRPCFCCESAIKIKGDYIQIGNTYDVNRLPWDSVTYSGFRFDEPPLVFMLPNDYGGESAYIRAKNVTETGFEAANIEPQGEDGPHIAMDLSYIAVSRGIHDLGEHTLEACTIPVQTEQWNANKPGTYPDVNLSNQTPYGTISCDANGCWTKIAVNGVYTQPVIFATIITAENELRDEYDNASGREISRPWMTVAIKNDSSGIWLSLERSETTYGKITKPELIAYMITEGNIQSSFTDDFDNNVSYETIYVQDKFLGYDRKGDSDQRFDFNNTYTTNPKPLVMANKQSRNNPDGGWFRLNDQPEADHLKVSVWEDRIGSYNIEGNYDNPAVSETPIGISANQDTERSLATSEREDGAAIIFGGTFQYAQSYQAIAGSFDAVEEAANFNTILDTKIVNKPFELKYWSLDKDASGNTISKVINSPVKVDFIYTQNSGVNLECNNTANLVIPGSTQYANFVTPNPYIDNISYNITNSTAYRNVQVRFTYGADVNGTAVDWLTCYNNSADCGDTTYTAACTATCTQTITSAMSEACTECYFNNTTVQSYACSYDRFAIRPDSFDIAINGKIDVNDSIIAGTNFLIDVNASTYNGTNASQEYNATQDAGGSLSQFHIAPTDLNAGSGCATGLIVDVDDSNFTNGIFSDADGKYTEVGDINITVFEDPDKVFASVDTGNLNASLDSAPSIYTISSDSIEVHFTPDHFKVTSILSDFNNTGYTYLSRDLNMSSELNITITAENAEDNTTANYYKDCYSKQTSFDISYDNIVLQPTANLSNLLFHERNTSVSGTNPINTNIVLLNLSEDIFTTVDKGTANISIQINFDRDNNESVNPFEFRVRDINVSDTEGILGGVDANQTSTFLYGRTNSPRQRFISPVGTTGNPAQDFIYYEVYCEAGCDKTLLPNSLNSITTDDPRWFVNPAHTVISGTAGSVNQKGFGVGLGRVTGTATTGNDPDSTNLEYDGNNGYVYKTTMENNASTWLIYDKYDINANKNEFEVEFDNAGGAWAGQHETSTTTNTSGSTKTNRRSMW